MICKDVKLITFLNEPEIIFCTQLNGFKYCYEIVIISYQSIVCTHSNRYTWYVRNYFGGNFIFKWVRTNLFAD